MTKKTLLIVAVAALPLPGAMPAYGQEKKPAADVDTLIELTRKDVRAQKADIIGKTMALDAAQAAVFWPIYKQYEAERQVLGNDRLAIIQDLAEHYDSLNDAKAKGLLDRSFALETKRVALEKKYMDEMVKVMPAKVVARFFQVESRLNNLINLEVSSQIPLVH